MYKLGVIGFGFRAHKGIVYPLCELSSEICVTAIADPNPEKVRERIAEDPRGISDNVKFYDDAEKMLANEDLDGIIIGTRCSLHTEMAILAMQKRSVPIFLEKPVSVNEEQLFALKAANDKYNPRVTVSFPLRYTVLAEMVKDIISSGQIGDVLQVNAFNDVPYGRVYYHNWYRNESETGGLWLQKATHDFDYLNYVLGGDRFEEIFARYTRKLFKGDMPAESVCSECEKKMTCPEGPFMIKHKYMDKYSDEYIWKCCFAVDTGNEDCGTALLKCKSGAIATYSQNFFARHKAARRGARFYGYNGTLEFDWYTNEVKVFMHTSPRVESYKFDDKVGEHFGGDLKLAESYLSMLNGTSKKSYLKEGLESAAICLMAKKSCETGQNIIIPEM